MTGRFSFLDDDEDEVPATPIPGSFPFSFPNPGAPPPVPETLPETTPTSTSNEPVQNIPPSPPSSSGTPVPSRPESRSGDHVTIPDPEIQDIPTSVGPILLNGASTASSVDASVATTPISEGPTHILGAIDGDIFVPGSVPDSRGETPPMSEPDVTPNITNASPPIPTATPPIEPIPEEFYDETPPAEPQRPRYDSSQVPPEERGDFAANSFLETGDLEAASEAINEFKNILTGGPEVSRAERARVAEVLSTVLSQRFEHYGDVDDMEQAVETQLKLASLALEDGADPILRAKSHGGLGRTLTAQFEHTGDPDDAELAINHLNKALEMMSPGDPARPGVLADFARAELAQYAHSDNLARLEQALSRCEEALRSVPSEAPERTPLSGLIGGALLSRFERTHSAEDIARAVEYLDFAVTHTPQGNPERPKRMRSYGDAILARAVSQNDLNSLNTAIEIHRAALELLTPEHAAYPTIMGSLAKAFHTRYRSTNSMEDLDRAIDNLKTTVEYTSYTDPNHARITDLLGKSFMAKYRATTQPPRSHFLNYAITLHRQAVALTSPDHRHYAGRLESLGKAYSKRYRSALRRQSAQPSDLQEAERCLREAMNRDPSRTESVLHELGKLNQS